MNDDELRAAQRALLDKHREAQATKKKERRAPLPERVVRGSGVQRRFVRVQRNVDWDLWRNMPTAEIWEAVALSLGNSPITSSNGSASYYDDDYSKRLRIAKEHLSAKPGSALQLVGGPMGTNHAKVNLSAFRAWAVSLGWDLPTEFPRAAPEAKSAKGDVSKLDEWKSADLWSESDLQALCCGLVPNAGRAATEPLNDASEKIRRAVLAKKLPVASAPVDATAGDRMYDHHRFFEPAAATRWAKGKFSAFPFSASDFDGGELAVERKMNVPASRDDLGTRERDTLLKLVIGMAVEGYRYSPGAVRNEAPAEIASDLAKHGLSITDDTVRKWLKEAAEKVLPNKSK